MRERLEKRKESLEELIEQQKSAIERSIGQLQFLEGGLQMVRELLEESEDEEPESLTLEELGELLDADSIEAVPGEVPSE